MVNNHSPGFVLRQDGTNELSAPEGTRVIIISVISKVKVFILYFGQFKLIQYNYYCPVFIQVNRNS